MPIVAQVRLQSFPTLVSIGETYDLKWTAEGNYVSDQWQKPRRPSTTQDPDQIDRVTISGSSEMSLNMMIANGTGPRCKV